jgi:hypothetical protein
VSKNLITSQHSEAGKDVTFSATVGTVLSVKEFNQSSVTGKSSRRGMAVSTTHAIKRSMWIDVGGKELELSSEVGGVSARVGHKVAVISVDGSRLIYRDVARINLTTNTVSHSASRSDVAGDAMLGRIGGRTTFGAFVLGTILIACGFWFLASYFWVFFNANVGKIMIWSAVFFFIFPITILSLGTGKRHRARVKYENFLATVITKNREI